MPPHGPSEHPPDRTDRDSFRRIDRSIPCRGCRYDLRGLSAEGRCPECGLAVLDSLENHLPEQWRALVVERFTRGLRLEGSAWWVTGLLSLGCLALPIQPRVLPPLVLFMALCTAGRALARHQLHCHRSLLGEALPLPIWLFAAVPWTTAAIGLLLIPLTGLPITRYALFIVLLCADGVLWSWFLRASGRRVDCGQIETLGLIAGALWLLALSGLGLAALGLLLNGEIANGWTCCLLTSLLAWPAAVAGTALLTGSFADTLARHGHRDAA